MSTPDLDAIFAALADPTRRAIVARLATGEATVQELAEPFDISLPAISRHLKVLERAGLLTQRVDAQRRPCELRADALDAIAAWARHTKAVWESRFDQLDAYLKKLQKQQSQESIPSKSKKEKSHGRKK